MTKDEAIEDSGSGRSLALNLQNLSIFRESGARNSYIKYLSQFIQVLTSTSLFVLSFISDEENQKIVYIKCLRRRFYSQPKYIEIFRIGFKRTIYENRYYVRILYPAINYKYCFTEESILKVYLRKKCQEGLLQFRGGIYVMEYKTGLESSSFQI